MLFKDGEKVIGYIPVAITMKKCKARYSMDNPEPNVAHNVYQSRYLGYLDWQPPIFSLLRRH